MTPAGWPTTPVLPTGRPDVVSTPLEVELVPSTAWGSNLRSVLTKRDWAVCQQFVYARSGRRCEICSGRGPKWPVECHETWAYDDAAGTQTLTGLIALCPTCHRCKHAGFAASQGYLGEVLIQLCEVNGWALEHAELYLEATFEVWNRRSRQGWDLDCTWLSTIGLTGFYQDREERQQLTE